MATANPARGFESPLRSAKKVTGWYIVEALLFIALGVFAIVEPALAGLVVARFVGWLLIVLYFELRGTEGAGWMLVNGLITLLLGGLIWFHWPSSSTWAIGTLVGVTLLVTGWTRLMLGLGARRLITHTAG